ncbi:hypothetical protein Clacol_005364 [Clathrus columnatus]|uniref:Uncharacterized protein n=1 Tax=Clathrus columnatus TaxID=1419009 RepID=A0AAV5ACC2_9AGAM|nr:hypothetical protein Clacol_005364 [Clathrus columnatus]
MSESTSVRTQYSTSPTLVESAAAARAKSPNSIIKDLQIRVVNWAGVDISSLGRLLYHDTLTMRKASKEKEFQVYLFEEAMICLAAQKRSVLQSLGLCSSKSMPPPLRLKGRIFTKHITRIQNTSTDDEPSLTIQNYDISDDKTTVA